MRSRDFVLLTLTISFLLIAITATVSVQREKSGDRADWFGAVVVTETEFSAELPASDEPDRAERIASLKEKLAALGASTVSAETPRAPEVDGVPSEELVTSPASSTEAAVGGSEAIQLCATYQPATVVWPLGDIEIESREGVRVVYQVETVIAPRSVGSTSTPQATETETTLAQLPMRTDRLPDERCLSTDVVGVAQDGSLITNDNHTLYGIFGGETLIGYALDGYPIYGQQTAVPTDACGGAMVGGQYRYYLHPDRPGVLGCFAGVPVTL